MRTVAFYLPQFHAIPENDEWWGEGFTEWVNVRRARRSFDGHEHPRVPTDPELGEYDLTDAKVHRRQTVLACSNGIDAFCMYFYWFNGRRLLEAPVNAWRDDPTLLPYCVCWANESWTRRWDGKSRSVLMSQDYDPGFARRLFDDLLPHFRAPHYLTQDGAPILVLHRADLVPDVKNVARQLREFAEEAGLPGLHLVAAETKPGLRPASLGFDAVAEFPPVGANTLASAELRPLSGLDPDFRGRLMSYERMARRFAQRPSPTFTRYRGVAPGWDNTARRQKAATVYVGATPARFGQWLGAARRAENSERGDRGMVFINAWNEWAEGAYLEPDELHGADYLRAAGGADETGHANALAPYGTQPFWSLPQLRSLAIATAGSALSVARRVRNRLRPIDR